MVYRLLTITLLVCPLLGCTKMSDQTQSIVRFKDHFSNKISNEFGLRLYGFGSSAPENIQSIELSYQSAQEGTIETARSLIIAVIDRMVDEMNEDVKLRPFLSSYPATTNNVNLVISFVNPAGMEKCIDTVMAGGKGPIWYLRDSQDHKKLIKIHEESIEEAKRILDAE